MKFLDLDVPIWEHGGVVLQGGSPADFAAYAKKRFGYADVGQQDNAGGHIYFEEGSPWVLWVEDLKCIPILAHECLHLTFSILESRGLLPTEAAEEAYAYTLGWLMREILTAKHWKTVKR